MTLGGKIAGSKFGWIILLLILVGVNFIASVIHPRLDLTREKRYTLSQATRNLLVAVDDKVEIDIFLKGEFPSGFRKLANSTAEFLDLLKERNGTKISYRFVSPEDKMPGTDISYGDTLQKLGAIPINLTVQLKAGQSSNIIFPVALIHYKDKQSLVNLYPGASSRISQEELNSAEALMEYQFVNSLNKLVNEKKPTIGYAVGNGQPTDGRAYDLVQTLEKDYDFKLFNLQTQPLVPPFDVLLIVKPTQQFSEEEKLKIDQYLMQGGRLCCFIDNLIAEQDSLAGKPETIAFDRNLNLTDLFFRYGLRINTDLIMDLQADMIPFVVGGTMENPQFEFLHWNYFPLLNASSNKLNNLGYIAGKFVNSIDTIKVAGVTKTALLVSSPNSRIISTPARISLNENRNAAQDEKFKLNAIPAAMLLEGKFNSLYRNRVSQAQKDSLIANGSSFAGESVKDGKLVVVADGDIVLNEFGADPETRQPIPLPMGWNKYTHREYMQGTDAGKYFVAAANRDFLLGTMDYLSNNPAITATRNKEIVLRLLDSQKIREQKTFWQLINIALPVLLVILFGFIYQQVRKRRYAI